MEKVLLAEMPLRVYRTDCKATEIAGGFEAAIPHQAAVINVGFSLTMVPTKTAGIGYISVWGPSLTFFI
jgi:hypothetical protein